ncbi:MAG: entericidin A/B family lipoprotein [Verrucomicrobiota bacterium]
MKTISKILFASLLACGLLVLSGCNTVRGLGQDIEAAGESMQRAGD